MKFSFIIVTDGNQWDRIDSIISSIENEVPEDSREIVIVGGKWNVADFRKYGYKYTRKYFNELEKPGWITRKKNIGVQFAKYDNLVIMHDYYALSEGFYEGCAKFDSENPDWDLMMVKIETQDGQRYHDWCAWDDPRSAPDHFWIQYEPFCAEGRKTLGRPCMIPYDQSTPYWYIPGGAWIAKRQFMLENPLNESLSHCQAEDVCFSLSVRNKADYVMNTYSKLKLLKPKNIMLPKISLHN